MPFVGIILFFRFSSKSPRKAHEKRAFCRVMVFVIWVSEKRQLTTSTSKSQAQRAHLKALTVFPMRHGGSYQLQLLSEEFYRLMRSVHPHK